VGDCETRRLTSDTHRYLRYNVLGDLRGRLWPRCRGQDQAEGCGEWPPFPDIRKLEAARDTPPFDA
jgi:hypothetical protein